ncbi:MAG TPA: dihydropteroate synthase [Verrucomicrobiae bacterium]|nr:dihydropteroate synthase [Verrucomicrobiae bacterium]
MLLKARQFQFEFPRPAMVMGILNVTPDSFSDGGQFLDPDAAVARGLELVRQGADILDVGGESSRPRAVPVPEPEEERRVVPVIARLAKATQVPISVDTMKASVARAALQAGAAIINDVMASRQNEEMFRLVAETGAGYVCMHMRGTPQTMQSEAVYEDVVAQVFSFFSERMNRMAACGVKPEQLILDPGIGFGKTAEHNFQLLGALRRFTELERPVMVGVSRKSFLGKPSGGTKLATRLPGSLACAALALAEGAQLIRAHDVAETMQAMRVAEEILKYRI